MSKYLEQRRQLKLNGKPEKIKKVYKIKPRSKKRIAEQKVYVGIVKEMAAESDLCELRVPGVCTGKMEGLHHVKKRGIYFLDKRYLKRSCNNCNNFCEEKPLAAIALGISISKFSKE